MEHESDSDTSCNQSIQCSHQKIGKEAGGIGNKSTRRDYPNYGIIKVSLNTGKSPGDLRRLTVTQAQVEGHQLMLVWKTLKGLNIIIIIMTSADRTASELQHTMASETCCISHPTLQGLLFSCEPFLLIFWTRMCGA